MGHGYDLWCLGPTHLPFDRAAGPCSGGHAGHIPQPRHFGERFGGSVVIMTLRDGAPTLEQRHVGHLRFVNHWLMNKADPLKKLS